MIAGKDILIEPQYAGPIAYFSILMNAGKVTIEAKDNFRKGSYRNRCHIMGANGLLRLSIPLEKGKNQNTPMDKVTISYNQPWQKIHWESLCSAYRRSPYFEYYEPELTRFYEDKFEFLFDFNQQLFDMICKWMKLEIDWKISEKYQDTDEFEGLDLRGKIHPNSEKSNFLNDIIFPEYIQVFSDRFGFLSNLSIFDLVFNQGPHSKEVLEQVGYLQDDL